MRLTIWISLFILSGCGGFPLPQDRTRCIADIENMVCTCRTYHVGINYVGNLKESVSVDYPIMKCHKLVGFPPESWMGMTAWFKKIAAWLESKGFAKTAIIVDDPSK